MTHPIKENLKSAFKNIKGKIVSLIGTQIAIKHKDTKLEYTVDKIFLEDGKPVILAYRYYSKPNSFKKIPIKIYEKEFKDYDKV
jgi:hypothetical protein